MSLFAGGAHAGPHEHSSLQPGYARTAFRTAGAASAAAAALALFLVGSGSASSASSSSAVHLCEVNESATPCSQGPAEGILQS